MAYTFFILLGYDYKRFNLLYAAECSIYYHWKFAFSKIVKKKKKKLSSTLTI